MASNNLAKGLKRSALTLALSMCFVGAALAAETGGLRITVTGNNGQPVAGATVKVSSPSSLVSKTGVTGADGSLNLQGLDPATNYTVQVVAPGYNDYTASNVAVVSGKNLSVGYALGVTSLDAVVVTGASLAAVDTTSATVGTTLTLDTVESLPTGRSYQSYLQLVPGVKPSPGGNPSSKSGVNYSDIGGATGTSTDNVYYLDGVDVTDPNSGTFGANFNSEIIQEQQVITGGVPAEYAGGSGLISKVVTKSGGDEFHGSINYYLQNDNLVAKDKHGESNGFSTYDAAVTLGGPIIKQRLWFFGSYQKKSRTDDVVNPLTDELLRTVDTNSHYGFLKATWQITDDDRLTAEYFNDPYTRSGSTDSTVLNNRDLARRQGGDNYKLDYSHDWENLRLNLYGFRHEGELASIPAIQDARNDVAFYGRNATNAERQLGGSGTSFDIFNNRDEYGLNLEYWLDTAFGSHTFKVGFSDTENLYKEASDYTGADHARYVSIAAEDAGVSVDQYFGSGWSGTRSITATDATRILNAMNNGADSAYYLGLLDTNSDGEVSDAELRAYHFTSTSGNPNGQVNAYRIIRQVNNPYSVKSKGKTFYLQDTWTKDQWTVNAGVRGEQWRHYASDGTETYTFDWKFAPRLSVVYDLNGDGRSKVWGFVGRYYDPIRTNMSDFAGALTGPEDAEQIYVGDRWLTYRTRGGATTPDAVFAPSTKTPYTDEMMIGYATTFGRDLSLSVTLTNRVTKNLLEDYDLSLYSDPTTPCEDPEENFGYACPGSAFYLPYSYFGYDSQPNSNYVIATLAGGKREYQGLEVTLTKQKSDNWQGLVSYTYNNAHGNSNSDSNADFQGDWIALDPRAPNQWGPQPGNIEHQLKAYGVYYFDFGLELSGVFNWNSGIKYSRTFAAYGRHLPEMSDGYEYGGVYDSWILPGAVGGETGPSYYTLDMRAKYTYPVPVGKLELFLDVFNILDKQSPIAEQDLVGGDGVYAFGEANQWVAPRRAYLGVRYSF
jgi:hypothetical protein